MRRALQPINRFNPSIHQSIDSSIHRFIDSSIQLAFSPDLGNGAVAKFAEAVARFDPPLEVLCLGQLHMSEAVAEAIGRAVAAPGSNVRRLALPANNLLSASAGYLARCAESRSICLFFFFLFFYVTELLHSFSFSFSFF